MGTVEMGANSTGPEASLILRSRLLGGPAAGRRRIDGVLDHFLRALHLLLRGEKRGVNHRCLLEFGQSLLQFALVPQQHSVMDHGRGRLETHALERGLVAQILWLQVVGLFVELVSGLVFLARLGVLALVIAILGLIGDGRKNGNHDQQHYRCGHQTSHSSVLIYKVFRRTSSLHPEGQRNWDSLDAIFEKSALLLRL